MVVAAKNIYIVGIGGIGLSSLAQLLYQQGKRVSGSDRAGSSVTSMLEDQGIKVWTEQKGENVPEGTELIIYSDAVPVNSPERVVGRERGIPELSYFEALGQVANGNYLIVVSGTHGKTTTTAMIADVLEDAGLDPTVVVGSIRTKTKSNFQAGKSNFFIVEADEYLRHFLFFKPTVLVITNIDEDHLDYYKDLADIQNAFQELARKVPKEGYIITNPTDPHIAPVLEGVVATVIDYTKVEDIPPLQFPGAHNIWNARAALAVAGILEIKAENAKQSLKDFQGTARRFEYKGETSSGALVYDDYGHNPQKVAAAIAGAREKFPDRKLFVVFQPHLYSRTRLLLKEFATSFKDADEVIILPIFAAREKEDGVTTNETLARAIQDHHQEVYSLSFEEAAQHLQKIVKAGDVVLTLGAGEAYRVGGQLLA